MFYRGHDIRISKNKIIYEIDNKRYNLRNINDYKEFIVNPIRQELDGIDLAQFIDESLAEEQTNNNKKGDYYIMLPSHNDVIGNKSFPYNTYAILMSNSNFDPAKKDGNYIYKKDIPRIIAEAKKEFPNGTIPAIKTVEKHIKTMLECDIPLLKVENSKNGLVYKLTPKVDGKYYVRLPYQQVRELIISTNNKVLKLFVILSYMCDFESYTTIDRKYFARQLGLSDKSDKTLKEIGIMLNSLRKLGFIDIKQEIRTDYDKEAQREVGKKVNSYRLTTLDEYNKINKITRVK